MLSVALFHDDLLLVGRSLHGHDRQPSALVVLNVGADLAGHLSVAKAIQEIVLHLEEVAHLEQNCLGLSIRLGVGVSDNVRKNCV